MAVGVTLINMGDLARREAQRLVIWRDVFASEGKTLAAQQARDLETYEAIDRLIERVRADTVIMERLKGGGAR